mmetsp:Transcript_47855/g.89117  ORF Transcript_47855/g.89117 Transcript_47855/m.89117 type:complete len:212 (-) Transcript_47855:411-1046(-)
MGRASVRDCKVAKVSGFPGFIRTRPKCTEPLSSSSGLMRSRSPMETPPEVSSTSAPHASAASNWAAMDALVSKAIPRSKVRAPHACAAARSMLRLESRIWPGFRWPGSVAGSTTSSPLDITATLGAANTCTVAAPAPARRPTSPGPSTSPACRMVWPAWMSQPTGRMSWPLLAPSSMRTRRLPSEHTGKTLVRSTITTASAPLGTGPPVVM